MKTGDRLAFQKCYRHEMKDLNFFCIAEKLSMYPFKMSFLISEFDEKGLEKTW